MNDGIGDHGAVWDVRVLQCDGGCVDGGGLFWKDVALVAVGSATLLFLFIAFCIIIIVITITAAIIIVTIIVIRIIIIIILIIGWQILTKRTTQANLTSRVIGKVFEAFATQE